MLLSWLRKSPWTLRKVIPCVLQPNSNTTDQQSMLVSRAREGQWDMTNHPANHTHSTAWITIWNTFSRPPTRTNDGGHSPLGGRLNRVEACAGARHVKPTLQNEQRPSKQAPLN